MQGMSINENTIYTNHLIILKEKNLKILSIFQPLLQKWQIFIHSAILYAEYMPVLRKGRVKKAR